MKWEKYWCIFYWYIKQSQQPAASACLGMSVWEHGSCAHRVSLTQCTFSFVSCSLHVAIANGATHSNSCNSFAKENKSDCSERQMRMQPNHIWWFNQFLLDWSKSTGYLRSNQRLRDLNESLPLTVSRPLRLINIWQTFCHNGKELHIFCANIFVFLVADWWPHPTYRCRYWWHCRRI